VSALATMTAREEEQRARQIERQLAKGRRTAAANRAKRRREKERGKSKLRTWTAREAQAFEAYTRERTPGKRKAWLRTWHDQPTFEEARTDDNP
jgi:hypothetical protein